MEMNVLYNVPHAFALSDLISTYFFLLGVGGGCSLLSVWATLTGKTAYKPLAKLGAIAVVVLFSLAPTLLIVGGEDADLLALNRQALTELRAEKWLEVVPGASRLFDEPGALERVAELASRFMVERLGYSVPAQIENGWV